MPRRNSQQGNCASEPLLKRVEDLMRENCQLRAEMSALAARAALLAQHEDQLAQYEDQRLLDAVRFRAILAKSRSGILLLAPNGNVVEITHSIFGHGRNLLGRSATEVMRPESAARFHQDLEYVVQTPGAERQGEYCIVNSAGEERWMEAILSDYLSEPAIQAIICNYRDITDRKLANTCRCQDLRADQCERTNDGLSE